MTYRFYTIVMDRRLIKDFDTEIEAEQYLANNRKRLKGAVVTPMTVPGR